MERMRATCDNCDGSGYAINWEVISENTETGIGTIQSKEVTCPHCNGHGWIEYAVFSIEEAEAILKHCGLSTES